MGRDIGEAAAFEVGVLGEVRLDILVDVLVEIVSDSFLLVPCLIEVVAEASRTRRPGNLWRVGLSSAHGCDVGACPGELRCEFGGFLAVVGLARGTDT